MSGYPHMANLVIGVPFSGKNLPYTQLLTYANFMGQVPMNYNARYFHTAASPIDQARNFFADQAVEAKAKYLAMWDEDTVVPPYWMRQLIFWLEHNDDWAMVGGIYCQKNEPERTCAPMVFREMGRGPFWKWRAGELFEVDAIATGCCLIRVAALADIEKPWFKTEQDFEKHLDNIPMGTSWTEDLWFCDRLKKTGKWKIYADGSLLCGHMDLESGKVYGLPPDSYPMRRLVMKKGKRRIIDIGCGPSKYQTDEGDVVGVDIRDMDGVDYRVDIRRMPFETGSWDIVYSSHVLEHFGRNEAEEVLDEWVRLLAPDGEFRLIVPNIAWAAEQLKKGIVDNDVLNVLYGQQEYRENFHKCGYTPEIIRAMLEKRGFKQIEIRLDGYNILTRATRRRLLLPAAKKNKKR